MSLISKYIRNRQLRLIKEGRCKICGKKRNCFSKIYCLEHLIKQRKHRQNSYWKHRKKTLARQAKWRKTHPKWWRKYN